jgi:G3E family GTPase
MTDAEALAFVGKLKQRGEITPAERQAIALSVTQSELISDEDVKQAEQWIAKENPSLEMIESHAEELRKRTAPELRLFPQVGTVKQSVQEFHRNSQ